MDHQTKQNKKVRSTDQVDGQKEKKKDEKERKKVVLGSVGLGG